MSVCGLIRCRTVTNLSAIDDAEEEDYIAETDGTGTGGPDEDVTPTQYNKYKPRRAKKSIDPVEQEMLKVLKQEQKDDDEDRAFFLSLYGDWKRLNLSYSAKMRVKMNLMQVFCMFFTISHSIKNGPILIILLPLQSVMNCRIRWYKNFPSFLTSVTALPSEI